MGATKSQSAPKKASDSVSPLITKNTKAADIATKKDLFLSVISDLLRIFHKVMKVNIKARAKATAPKIPDCIKACSIELCACWFSKKILSA